MSFILTGIGILTGLGAASAMARVSDDEDAPRGEYHIDINNGAHRFTVKSGIKLLDALHSEGIYPPSACGGNGKCGFCRCRVEAGGGPLSSAETSLLKPTEIENHTRLACQVTISQDLRLHLPPKLLQIRRYQGRVKRLTELTYDIKEVAIELTEPATIDYRTGQYLQLQSEKYGDHVKPVSRAYSIASVEDDKHEVELIIRRVPNGICTTWVHEHLREGQTVWFTGPHGDFHLRNTTAPIIMIAGGSGLAPFKGMLRKMARDKNPRKARFFFGANTERDLYHLDLMKRLETDLADFRFIPALCRPEGAWKGEIGLITEVVDRLAENVPESEAYLCGSPVMIEACLRVLRNHGLREDRIYYDKFS